MYIKTRNVTIKEEALEAYITSGTAITFHLVSGTEITVEYTTTEAVERALSNLNHIITNG
jgi:hypothetical protein